MATIDSSYFFGPLTIPQKSDAAVSSSLTWLINELEPKLLTDLLGYELYKTYAAGIAVLPTPDAKWTDLRDGKEYTNRSSILTKWKGLKYTEGTTAKKSLIANYVYWHWMEKEASASTGTGEKVPNAQNAVNTSPIHKMVRAWNEMVCMNFELIEFLLSNQSTYPEFVNHYGRIPRTILKKQNAFGI
jgi:hypothetical protein